MKIVVASIFVDDQEKALKFYTEKLGLVKKQDVSLGEYKWLTVVSAEDENGTELLLEPNNNPAAQTFQQDIFKQGIPATSFWVEDVEKECERLKALGVTFTMEPTKMGPVTVAVLNDSCGNLIQIQKMN